MLHKAWPHLLGFLFALVLGIWSSAAISVELSEVLGVGEATADGEFTRLSPYRLALDYDDINPIDNDCSGAKCLGIFTRDGSLEFNSKYGCTQPDQSFTSRPGTCGVEYNIERAAGDTTLSAVHIAFHPDSSRKIQVLVDGAVVVDEWEGSAGEEMQAIPGVEGAEGSYVTVQGVLEVGEYLGILEVEIYVEVDEVDVTGVFASSRIKISSTATTDDASAMNTLDGDASDQSAWTCVLGEVCEITYDFGAVESLEQVRVVWCRDGGEICAESLARVRSALRAGKRRNPVLLVCVGLNWIIKLDDITLARLIAKAFSDNTDTGGEFSIYAAGEAGIFYSVRTEIEAGGRPVGSDGLQTFGGVRALARYVKIEVTPSIGGTIGITEVEFQIGENTPQRAVAEKRGLKETGPLPAGRADDDYDFPTSDVRVSSEGGCDSPGIFRGCHIFYIKVPALNGILRINDGDMSSDSRWSCGPTAVGDDTTSDTPYDDGTVCGVVFELNIFRYVRQIQLAFHLGDEQHSEFAIQAYTKNYEWVTVVPSAISSGTTVDLETFDISVHTDTLRIVPSFQSIGQMFSIKEMVILENAFVEGTVPVFNTREDFDVGEGITTATTRFRFDIPGVGDSYRMYFAEANVSGLRMKFPKDKTFTFDIVYRNSSFDDISQRYTSAGGDKTFETFTLSAPSIDDIEIVAVEGPTLENNPSYPTLRVVDFQILGEISKPSGTFDMVSTAITTWGYYDGAAGWGRIPDLIAEASADQKVIMTAICETKGAAFDGTDCVGDLDETAVTILLPPVPTGSGFFVNGPIFLKSNVTLEGQLNVEFSTWSDFFVYDGPNISGTGEDAVIVIDGATSVSLEYIEFRGWWEGATGPIKAGTVGNICLEVRNSQDIRLEGQLEFAIARSGAARFTDSSDITAFAFWVGEYETGNFLELTRVEDFYISVPPEMTGLLIDSCTDVVFEGAYDPSELPNPGLYPPTGGEQTSNVVITGDSTGIVFKNMPVGPGIEPRILMETTEPLTLDDIPEYEEAETGDCIVQVPEGSTGETLIQLNSEDILTLSETCWVF